MEVALALVLPLAGAFLFLESSLLTSYRVAREDGNRLYFRVAALAAVLFIVALLIRSALITWVSSYAAVDRSIVQWIVPLLKDPKGADAQSGIVLTAVFAFVLALVFPIASNRFVPKQRFLWRAVKDDDLEAMLQRAALEVKPISITLSSQKVYVGFVQQTFDPRRDRKWVTLLPLVSGYRTDTGKVIFTTFYDEIYRELPEARDSSSDHLQERASESAESKLTLDDFRIVLPLDKALAFALFDLRVYQRFNLVVPTTSEDQILSTPSTASNPQEQQAVQTDVAPKPEHGGPHIQ